MRKGIYPILAAIIFLSGCSKGKTDSETTDIYGMYNSSSGDTVIVSRGYSENRLWMRFAYKNPVGLRAVFDSVALNKDLTFTINEQSIRNGNPNWPITVVGGGTFGENVLNLNFSVGAGLLTFNCAKKQGNDKKPQLRGFQKVLS